MGSISYYVFWLRHIKVKIQKFELCVHMHGVHITLGSQCQSPPNSYPNYIPSYFTYCLHTMFTDQQVEKEDHRIGKNKLFSAPEHAVLNECTKVQNPCHHKQRKKQQLASYSGPFFILGEKGVGKRQAVSLGR